MSFFQTSLPFNIQSKHSSEKTLSILQSLEEKGGLLKAARTTVTTSQVNGEDNIHIRRLLGKNNSINLYGQLTQKGEHSILQGNIKIAESTRIVCQVGLGISSLAVLSSILMAIVQQDMSVLIGAALGGGFALILSIIWIQAKGNLPSLLAEVENKLKQDA